MDQPVKDVFEDWPMFGLADEVRPVLAEAMGAGKAAVLATLCGAEGGAPLGVGAQMLFTEDAVTGFLSGGCVEADVALHAAEVMQDGVPRRLVYGEGGIPDIRLPCGGRATMLVERIAPDDPAAERLLALGRVRSPALWLSDGSDRLCLAAGEPVPLRWRGLIERGVGRCVMEAGGLRYARRHDPAQRLLVVGADPIALAVSTLGTQMGWDTVLLRPYGPERGPPIPGLNYLNSDAATGVSRQSPDPWTAVVVATHGAEHDHAAVKAAVLSDAGYIGLLGSRRRLPDRLQRLRSEGMAERDLQRVRAPVGLPIRALAPFEVAVSIIGEIVAARHEREAAAGFWPAPPAPVEVMALA